MTLEWSGASLARGADGTAVQLAERELDRTLAVYTAFAASVERFRVAFARHQRVQLESRALLALMAEGRLARAQAASSRESVHVAIDAYVVSLRVTGCAPEHALLAVKRRVNASAGTAPEMDTQRLLTDAAGWAIDAYFPAA